MKYIVDRFEEDFAVLEKESGGTVDVDIRFLPGVKKGDVVVEEDGVYRIDENLTKERKASVMKKLFRLFGKK